MDPPLRRIQKQSFPFVGAGPRPARRFMRRVREAAPYGSAPAVTCSAKPGADVESHQLQFLESQGPVARIEPRKTTQILRAGSAAKPSKYASPRNGVLGDGRHGGRGGAAASADCARPLASFGSFSTWKRNSPRTTPAGAFRSATAAQRRLLARRWRNPALPPGWRPHRQTKELYHRPLIRPSVRTGAPSPQGGRLLRIIISE